ncbi:hypothetical protein LJC22_05765 [Desulfosarcina sp. OttesenSCG-928-G10]|nr:hypothetical protein [Desulfosarcina sp. OttesenSCG-928-G10]
MTTAAISDHQCDAGVKQHPVFGQSQSACCQRFYVNPKLTSAFLICSAKHLYLNDFKRKI